VYYVGRLVNPTGNRFSVIFHGDKTTAAYIKALEAKNIDGAGFSHVGVGDTFKYLYQLDGLQDMESLLRTGIIFIAESGIEQSQTVEKICINRIPSLFVCFTMHLNKQKQAPRIHIDTYLS
jgi:hypothetical protein